MLKKQLIIDMFCPVGIKKKNQTFCQIPSELLLNYCGTPKNCQALYGQKDRKHSRCSWWMTDDFWVENLRILDCWRLRPDRSRSSSLAGLVKDHSSSDLLEVELQVKWSSCAFLFNATLYFYISKGKYCTSYCNTFIWHLQSLLTLEIQNLHLKKHMVSL